METAPLIIHGARMPARGKIEEIINRAAYNACMTKLEKTLLLYYASNGREKPFRPAKKTIHNATGIPETRIKNVRRRLQSLSVIDYENSEKGHYVFVNWTNIYGYADMQERLEVGGRGRKYFVQQSQNQYERHPQKDKIRRAEVIEQLCSDNYLSYLARLSESEYNYARHVIKTDILNICY